ncbi:uncharacterized protein LOC129581284 [Paramacrobiotus metropolitanus]|uniref:uncharacterized protein LOC129581284 n=1 Tax=Paramacrobiotus metropolitanus TaxID=2943436 RepID=UPI00244609C0|nr:uncharacterized protein LOC129581284 [Paramacrobiotus metropolitanus]
MEQADEDLGWIKDEDIYGNEIYRPNLKQAALFMELICSGTMPQLEWRSPGRVPMAPARSHAHPSHFPAAAIGVMGMQRRMHAFPAHLPNLPKEQPPLHPSPMLPPQGPQLPRIAQSPKPVAAQASPFDFDDTEKLESSLAQAARSQAASPLKMEPRKRIVGSLSNVSMPPPQEKPGDFIPAAMTSGSINDALNDAPLPLDNTPRPPIFAQASPPKPAMQIPAGEMPALATAEAASAFPVTPSLDSNILLVDR